MARGRGRPRGRPAQKRLATPSPSSSQSSELQSSHSLYQKWPSFKTPIREDAPLNPNQSIHADQGTSLYANWISAIHGSSMAAGLQRSISGGPRNFNLGGQNPNVTSFE